MQSPLTAMNVSAISTKNNLCRTHTTAAATTTIKTPIVIQKSESFHVENHDDKNNLVIRNKNNIGITSDSGGYPKLKRTTSSDIDKSIFFNFNGTTKTRSTTQDNCTISGNQQQVKTKSDFYTFLPENDTNQRKKSTRNLYENNYHEYFEKEPLLPIDGLVREINVKNDDSNVVLVYTAKNTKEKLHQPKGGTKKLPEGIKIDTSKATATNKVSNNSSNNWRHSWYAPVYGVLEEEGEHSIKESASLHNLAGVKKLTINGTHESASLLDNNQYTTTATSAPTASGRVVPQRTAQTVCIIPSGVNDGTTTTGDTTISSVGSTAPRKRKFEQFLKNLVSRRASKEPASPPLITTTTNSSSVADLLKASKRSPSEQNLTRSRLNGGSTASLTESVHQKLWSVVPLLRKNGSCGSLHLHPPRAATFAGIEYTGLRKCETVLALTHHRTSTGSTEPIRPLNRLRHCTSVATCSRCSSLLSLAGGSKYSLNVSSGGGGFIPVSSSGNFCSSGSHSGSNHSGSSTSQPSVVKKSSIVVVTAVAAATTPAKIACKLCLGEFKTDNLTKISQCGCSFCTECMTAYVEFEIAEGAYEVSCPDAMCPAQGVVSIAEIKLLAAPGLVEKHHRYRLNREVELDKYRTWCPKAGCETICLVGPTTPSPSTEKVVTFQPSSSKMMSPCAVHCPTCRDDFCSGCKKPWHPTMTCEENTKRLAATGKIEILGIPFDSDLIKCCPMCAVPIEKDEGCAQMMCKRCKHVFCWYCLASLDDDFLLRHYDKGPCKNKLGHSRASVVWHRAQVIGIFAGFGILLLVASPLLLLAAPCIVCCKCRICSGAAKLEDQDTDLDDGITLQR